MYFFHDEHDGSKTTGNFYDPNVVSQSAHYKSIMKGIERVYETKLVSKYNVVQFIVVFSAKANK